LQSLWIIGAAVENPRGIHVGETTCLGLLALVELNQLTHDIIGGCRQRDAWGGGWFPPRTIFGVECLRTMEPSSP